MSGFGAVGGFQAGGAAIPSSKVEISVSCRNLRNMDYMSKSDPMCVMYTKDIKTNKFMELGRTETIQDNLNPDFTTKFVIDYFFEESQKLKFEVYDIDNRSRNLVDHDFIGSIELTLGEIVGSPGGSVVRNLLNGNITQRNGQISLRTEELSSSKEIATFQFQGKNLDQKNWFWGKSDPFLTFYRANEDNSYTAVHRTEVIKNTLNPNWKAFTLPLRKLCNGDYDRSIKVECHDWESSGDHIPIGEFTTNVRELSSGSTKVFEIFNPKKKKKKAGDIHLMRCHVEEEASFLDYIKGGMQMNFTVAIDFTASNGNPQNPSSLHYYNPYQMNQYASAITSVGEIIQDYDSDKMYPALGFGARMPDGNVSHEFALNFQPTNPFCSGVDGILAAYYHSIQCVQLYGPTNFSPVIRHVARFAQQIRDGSEYFVLLIITDGIITDMQETKTAIVDASTLPMSIIIVGVGSADFAAMDELDGDEERLSSRGRYAERDIVQFVPYSKFLSGNMQVAQAYLAKEVLAEIPDQVLAYTKRYSIKPRPPTLVTNAPLPPHGNAPPPPHANAPPPPQANAPPPPYSQAHAPYPTQ